MLSLQSSSSELQASTLSTLKRLAPRAASLLVGLVKNLLGLGGLCCGRRWSGAEVELADSLGDGCLDQTCNVRAASITCVVTNLAACVAGAAGTAVSTEACTVAVEVHRLDIWLATWSDGCRHGSRDWGRLCSRSGRVTSRSSTRGRCGLLAECLALAPLLLKARCLSHELLEVSRQTGKAVDTVKQRGVESSLELALELDVAVTRLLRVRQEVRDVVVNGPAALFQRVELVGGVTCLVRQNEVPSEVGLEVHQ
ncbi:hypothetical protein EXIGLDRAFT_701240 [Exidia glandulosa HHB12029]|uniref:Uncharacterized protein n=1 Tax=Exidia glandulosa HHB12029 TaxID=1314781 RepID=A0A165D1H3_EXIGL|nr:hypothetical protein EXIGLDRAFT_701240 [Exidia glandulosa HHB12029]